MLNFEVVENGCINSGERGGLVVTNEVSKDLWGPTAHRKREVPGVMVGMHGKYPSRFPMRQIKQEKSSTVLVTQIWLNEMYCPGAPLGEVP
jgi:hypothetical protein